LLFSAKRLEYGEHSLKVTNLGPKHRGEGTDLLVDFLKTTVDIAPAGYVTRYCRDLRDDS
jgi:hypothetical protein